MFALAGWLGRTIASSSRPLRTAAILRACCHVLALGTLGLVALSAAADERILGFHSEIGIHADGSMAVTETIRVRAEGNQIRRGIFRDFPTDYRDRFGNHYRVGFEVTGVLRDGRAEPYFTDRVANGVRVYIGESSTFLDAGEYEYQLSYATNYQLGFFEDHDELYWNATGNGWAFPIDDASARVSLPTAVGADRLTMEGYTGAQGSTERAYRAEVDSDRSARIESTRGLGPREGLTLVMTWPKGVIEEPTAADRIVRTLKNNVGLLIALGCLIATFLYFLQVWRLHGRDPERGVIFPHYAPPDLISPASARHVVRMGYDQKCFSAAVINLAVKGYIEIDEDGGDYTLRPTFATRARNASADSARAQRAAGAPTADGPTDDAPADDASAEPGVRAWSPEHPGPLAPGERSLLDALFADGEPVLLKRKNHRALLTARAAHRNALRRNNLRIYFATNSIYLVPAILLVVIAAVSIGMLGAFTVTAIIALVLTVLLVPLFAYLLKAPTRIGRKLLDKIEGFKLYLDVAEKDELNLRNPPEKTPELFEAFLPYAFALGVEQSWAERFDDVFARIEAQTGRAYQPYWYQGNWRSGGRMGYMTSRMTSALGSAIASASTPPGSSSGSGGGGFSGGGGGGGGGGGW